MNKCCVLSEAGNDNANENDQNDNIIFTYILYYITMLYYMFLL